MTRRSARSPICACGSSAAWPRGAAGGLGFRRAGDVLARLVNDVEALDGLYLRILVPLAARWSCCLPAGADRAARFSARHGGRDRCSARRASCCPGSPRVARGRPGNGWREAMSGAAGRRAGRAHRPARGARVRRRGPHAGAGAGARGGAAGGAARAGAAQRLGRRGCLPVRPGGDACRAAGGRRRSGGGGRRRVPDRRGVRGGRAACRAPARWPATRPPPRAACWRRPRMRRRWPIPATPARCRRRVRRCASRRCASAGGRRPAGRVRRPDPGRAAGRARRAARPVRVAASPPWRRWR